MSFLFFVSHLQASKALEQKNHVIHALQLKLSELANEVDAAAVDAINLSVGSPSTSTVDFNIEQHSSGASSPLSSTSTSLLNASLLLQLQETSAKLQLAEAEIAVKDEEISRLSSELCSREIELLEALSSTEEQESAVQELAYMLAAREASHGALIDTVHAFVSQNISSLPPTPRDAITTTNIASAGLNTGERGNPASAGPTGESAVESSKKLETMVSFWQERLEAQAAELTGSSSAFKLKELRSDSGNGVGFSDSHTKVDDENCCDDDDSSEDGSSSDGDTVTPPADRKGASLPCSTSLGPVTPF